MLDKIISFFDQDNEFKEVWELKLIKFDIDLDEEIKPYENQGDRYLAISHIVEDTKGNPGLRGHFYVTNLRIVWHGANDRDINLSIGIDTINNIYIKPAANMNSNYKQILVVKTQSPGGSKYEFKFSIFTDKEVQVFKKAVDVFKEAVSTRLYRTIDTNMKINFEKRNFELLPKEEIFNAYPESKYYESERVFDCDIILTNVRVVILMANAGKGISYGIPWIMLESYDKTQHWDHNVFELKVRGILSDKEIYIRTAVKNWSKLEAEFTSLASTYTKNPVLGIDVSKAISKDGALAVSQKKPSQVKELEETYETKINIKRTKNTYAAQSSQGALSDTFFNEELGLMMEALPAGATRSSLWEILG